MKKFAFVILAVAYLGLPSSAAALPLCGSGTDVLSYNAGGGCEIDGLVFSDFSVVDAGNPDAEMVNAVASAVVGNVVYFQFNPNLASPGVQQDIHFYFKVSGADIFGVDLYNGGTGNTSINEQLCSDSWFLGTCTGSLIGSGLFAGAGQYDDDFFDAVSTAYVFKDLFKGLETDNLNEGHLTSFTQSFHVVPEPGTIMLIGTGLVGLARRRMTRKV